MNKKAFFAVFDLCRHQIGHFFEFDLCVCGFLVQLGGGILVEWES